MSSVENSVPVLTTRSAAVKAARLLLRSTERRASGRFLLEGPRPVEEALVGGHVVDLFVSASAAERHHELVAAASRFGVAVHLSEEDVIEALSTTVTPVGLVAVCGALDVSLASVLEHPPYLLTLLAQVRDPGNAGTVLRTSDAAGAGAVVLTSASVDLYNPKCVRSSAGSLFHLPVVTGVELPAAVDDVRAAGLRVLAADGHGDRDLDDELDAGGLEGPTCWLFGNEAWGLPTELLELADAVVRVPIHGRAESLNLAAAAAVCLYFSARAQRPLRTVGSPPTP